VVGPFVEYTTELLVSPAYLPILICANEREHTSNPKQAIRYLITHGTKRYFNYCNTSDFSI
jgi:hypothetical protein